MMKIGVLAALPQEYAPFAKALGRWTLLEKKPFKRFSRSLPDKEILLIETGMGAGFAADALMSALSSGPDLVISCGFAGGLHPELSVGAICAPQKILMLDPLNPERNKKIFRYRLSEDFSAWLFRKSIVQVTAVTVSQPPDKRLLSSLLGGEHAVVDMETAELVRIAHGAGVPLLCLRAVSDSVSDELGFDLADITGEGGRVEVLKVLKTIASNPVVVRDFYRSWRRSGLAGKNLSAALADLMKIPAVDLGRMTESITIERM